MKLGLMMRRVRGTRDIYPSEFNLFEKILETSRNLGILYGFEPFSIPIMEYTNIFNRTLGDSSDVVSKEMYSFEDRGGDSITLRPEFTAGVMRSVISESKTHSLPLRLFTSGPVFRYDRPQAGRQRQFHQINFEIIGEDSVIADLDIIKLSNDILKNLGINNGITLEINSLGCLESRKKYQKALYDFLINYENDLSQDSKARLHKNPLRILDSKNTKDQEIVHDAPNILEFQTNESRIRFDKLLDMLTNEGIDFTYNKKLVRGLDYYTHTAFEFVSNDLGAQGTVIGGGRYDGLSQIMSKYEIPAIGFAGGIERLMILLKDHYNYYNNKIGLLPAGDININYIYKIATKLRENNIPVLIFDSGKMAKRIDKAYNKGCIAVLFIGEDEVKKNKFKFKDLAQGEEIELTLQEAISNSLKILQ